jgi:hypothetical protein
MVTHLIRDGEAVTDCCKKTPFELPRTDKLIVDDGKSHQIDCSQYGWMGAVKEHE